MPTFQEVLDSPRTIPLIFAQIHYFDVELESNSYILVTNVAYRFENSVSTPPVHPVIKGGLTFSESISTDGSISVSFGDITLYNNGEFDKFLDSSKYIFENQPIRVHYGDANVQYTSLALLRLGTELVFNGLISKVDCKSIDSISFVVVDSLQKLNTPVSEAKLGTYGAWGAGGNTNVEALKPLVFGEAYNITPLLIDPSTMEYMFNQGPSEQLIEIRDNGVPIYNSTLTSGATVNLTNSTFKLAKPLAGACTVSVQGVKRSIELSTPTGEFVDNTYVNNVPNLIALLARDYGNIVNRLLPSSIDLDNFKSFSTATPQPVGIYIANRENLLTVCQDLANSIGAQIYMTRKGLLQLVRIGTYSAGTVFYITPDHIYENTFSISNRTDVRCSTKIAYGKNWTVQPGLITAIPEQSKESFATEWLTTTVTDAAVKAAYGLNGEPEQKETMLISTSDAQAEASRLNTLYSIARTTFKFKGTRSLLSLNLGQQVNLKHPRYNLASGVMGQVVGLTPDWGEGSVEVEVLI